MKLAIFDIDGTLYDEIQGCYTPSSIQAIKRLQEQQILVVIATGRPPSTLKKLHEVGIKPDYLICSNGQLILDYQGNILFESHFPRDLTQEIKQYCHQHHMGLLLKYLDSTYVIYDHPGFQVIYQRNASQLHKSIIFSNEVPEAMPIGGCMGYCKDQLLHFNQTFQSRCQGIDIDGKYCDLILWGASKKTALQQLCQLIQVEKDDCIAFGDNLNDVEMIEWVRIGVAMGNGSKELKKRSDFVTKHIEENGIEYALQYFGLI